jgi:hypothetical protein
VLYRAQRIHRWPESLSLDLTRSENSSIDASAASWLLHLLRSTRFFLVQAGTDVDRIGWVDRAVSFLHVLNLALLVDNKRGTTGKLSLFIQDAVLL